MQLQCYIAAFILKPPKDVDLPQPKDPFEIDWRKSDYELFCENMGDLVEDVFEDAAWCSVLAATQAHVSFCC